MRNLLVIALLFAVNSQQLLAKPGAKSRTLSAEESAQLRACYPLSKGVEVHIVNSRLLVTVANPDEFKSGDQVISFGMWGHIPTGSTISIIAQYPEPDSDQFLLRYAVFPEKIEGISAEARKEILPKETIFRVDGDALRVILEAADKKKQAEAEWQAYLDKEIAIVRKILEEVEEE